MEPSARAQWYDLFKLLVAIILLILFLLLSWRQAPQTAIPQLESPTPTPSASTGSIPFTPTPSGRSTATQDAPAISSPQETSTSLLQTATTIPTSSPTQTNTPLPTNTPAITPSPLASPTMTPITESTVTPITAVPPAPDVCEAASARSRLQVGMNATMLRRLNFRSSPGIRDNWLLTNIPGTKVEVVGGPECIPHFIGAYLWWQIRLPDGRIGWSAEASVLGAFYFIEPVN